MKEAICRSLRQQNSNQSTTLLYFPRYRYPNRFRFGVAPSSSTPEWKKRALSDATLNAIEDYNKFIGATEALVSASIAVTGA